MNKDDIITFHKTLLDRGGPLHKMYEELEEMFFMQESGTGLRAKPASDEDDFKMTVSPSARNTVVGLVRLLNTSYPHFKAKSVEHDTVTSAIEALCEAIWTESCQAKMADIHTDLTRSAGLYGECGTTAKLLDDLILQASDDEKKLLIARARRTPALFEALRPPETYPYFGINGLRGVLRKYVMTGDDVKAQWKEADDHLKDTKEVTVLDWLDPTRVLIWNEGDTLHPFVDKEHGLDELLTSIQLADGSELWPKEEQKRQPFLYSLWKGRIWRRQTLLLSEIFTAISERGTGILVGVEQEPTEITVNYAGPGVRYITAKSIKMLSESSYDPELVALMKQVLDPLAEASTIFPQTLGSGADVGNQPYSSLALLSQSGQLPTVPVKKAVENCIKTVMLATLRRLKAHPPEAYDMKKMAGLLASDIPDDLTLDVSLDITLPQDMFRNATVAESLIEKGTTSEAWVRENVLQISDSAKMQKEIMKEQAAKAFFGVLLKQGVDQAMAAIAPPPVAGTETGGTGETAPGAGNPGLKPGGAAQAAGTGGPVAPVAPTMGGPGGGAPNAPQ